MIEIFQGRLGGGKSYSAVVRVLQHLRGGGVYFGNITLNEEAVANYLANYGNPRVVFQPDKQVRYLKGEIISQFHRHIAAGDMTKNILVVIDEAHLWFNSRDWDKTSREMLAFLTQSRKVCVDVIFITQHSLNMDKQFARLVQYYWTFKDLRKLILPILGIHYPFPHILALQCDYDGKQILDRKLVKIKPEVYNCYATNALLRKIEFDGESIPPVEMQVIEKPKREPLLRSADYVWFAICVVIALKIWVVSQY